MQTNSPMICKHLNEVPKGIKQIKKNKWYAVCGSCSVDKSFQFSNLETLMKQAQTYFQKLLQNILSLFSEYKSLTFSTFNSLYEMQSNRQKDVQFNSHQIQILQNSNMNINKILSKYIKSKIDTILLDLNQQIKTPNQQNVIHFRTSELVSNALGQRTSQIVRPVTKKPIQMIPIDFIKLPYSYPQPRLK